MGTIKLNHERERTPLRIVGDAAIAASKLVDGRLVPLIIVDTTKREDVEELIRVHEHFPPGDVLSQWVNLGSDELVGLVLTFLKPVESVAIIEFRLPKHAILIDQILRVRVLYLQAGREGDRFITTRNAPRIFVEVPDTGFGAWWEKLFLRSVVRDLRLKGLGRREAKNAARAYIDEFRKFGRIRM